MQEENFLLVHLATLHQRLLGPREEPLQDLLGQKVVDQNIGLLHGVNGQNRPTHAWRIKDQQTGGHPQWTWSQMMLSTWPDHANHWTDRECVERNRASAGAWRHLKE